MARKLSSRDVSELLAELDRLEREVHAYDGGATTYADASSIGAQRLNYIDVFIVNASGGTPDPLRNLDRDIALDIVPIRLRLFDSKNSRVIGDGLRTPFAWIVLRKNTLKPDAKEVLVSKLTDQYASIEVLEVEKAEPNEWFNQLLIERQAKLPKESQEGDKRALALKEFLSEHQELAEIQRASTRAKALLASAKDLRSCWQANLSVIELRTQRAEGEQKQLKAMDARTKEVEKELRTRALSFVDECLEDFEIRWSPGGAALQEFSANIEARRHRLVKVGHLFGFRKVLDTTTVEWIRREIKGKFKRLHERIEVYTAGFSALELESTLTALVRSGAWRRKQEGPLIESAKRIRFSIPDAEVVEAIVVRNLPTGEYEKGEHISFLELLGRFFDSVKSMPMAIAGFAFVILVPVLSLFIKCQPPPTCADNSTEVACLVCGSSKGNIMAMFRSGILLAAVFILAAWSVISFVRQTLLVRRNEAVRFLIAETATGITKAIADLRLAMRSKVEEGLAGAFDDYLEESLRNRMRIQDAGIEAFETASINSRKQLAALIKATDSWTKRASKIYESARGNLDLRA